MSSTSRRVAVPILCYHEISDAARPPLRRYTITPKTFTRQMKWLAAAGYHAVSMDDLAAALAGAAVLPAGAVAITFDDGYESCVRYAPDVLKGLGFTATFYLVAGRVGTVSSWTMERHGVTLPLADWHAARELSAAGFTCGSHSLTHPHLARLTPADWRRELLESRAILEDGLGGEVAHLAYPYGSYDAGVMHAAREAGYATACGTEARLATPSADPMGLPRTVVRREHSLIDFVSIVHTGKAVVDHPRWRGRARAAGRALAGACLPFFEALIPRPDPEDAIVGEVTPDESAG